MIKRTLEISGGGNYLRVENNALVIENEERGATSVPLEDIGLVLLDHAQVRYTHCAITALAEEGAALVFCGQDHHPVGLLLPLAGNQLHTERLRAQVDIGKVLMKQLWQRIVQKKLQNQAANLETGNPARKRLETLASTVRSGDPDNCEAQGASIYFTALFGKDFRRDRDGPPPNNLLNYGYMALRASVARAICLTGLHPALGLHHRHRNNPFCLADDLMEPYRPYVDRLVKRLNNAGFDQIDTRAKRELLQLLATPVQLRKGKGPLLVGVHKSAASLAQSILEGKEVLNLPSL
jgi:CRISPR-associated protein Cas1